MTQEHSLHDLKVCLAAELKVEFLRIAALPFCANWCHQSSPEKVFERAIELYSLLQQLHQLVLAGDAIVVKRSAALIAKDKTR